MARFYGNVGYATMVKDGAGKITEDIIEIPYYGDVNRNSFSNQPREYQNHDFKIGNEISIVADDYAFSNFGRIRYVVWYGTRWCVNQVTIEPPRLTLSIGEVYNGPGPSQVVASERA